MVALTLTSTAFAQTLSSPSFRGECTFVLPAVGEQTSTSFGSLTAVGGITSGELTSPSFSTVLDVLCVEQGGCIVTLCGDCTGDGVISILDALAAAQHAVLVIMLMGTEFNNCDVDADMDVDILDALLIAQVASGQPTALVCC
jgi:hypothetical protein